MHVCSPHPHYVVLVRCFLSLHLDVVSFIDFVYLCLFNDMLFKFYVFTCVDIALRAFSKLIFAFL